MNFSLQQNATELSAGSSVILPLAKAAEGHDDLTTPCLKAADELLNGAITHAIASGEKQTVTDISTYYKNNQ